MSFSELDKLKALAIVHIFETSKPFGDYSAVAVLDDGAGISYGINQFTHKSGSLHAVMERYLKLCYDGRGYALEYFRDWLPELKDRSVASIAKLSKDGRLKRELGTAAEVSEEMQRAQREIAFEKYLKPSLDACEGSDFTLPMSLAVIYDSKNHGSYDRIRDRVQLQLPASIKPIEYEKEWISEYVRKRDAWLESVPRLKKTDYRTDFFLAQIARGNWNLDLPLNVHGFRLTDEHFKNIEPVTAETEPQQNPSEHQPGSTSEESLGERAVEKPQAEAPKPTDSPASLVPVVTPVIDVEQVKPEVEKPKEDVLTRVQNRFLAIPAAILAAIGSAVTWATSAPQNLVITLAIASAVIVLGYIAINAIRNAGKEKREAQLKADREKRAHELQLLTLKSAMEKDLNTVRIVPQTIQNSEANG